MKKVIGILMIASLIISACDSNVSENVEQQIVLTGSIANDDINELFLISSKNAFNYFSYSEALDSCKLDSAGNFSFIVPVTSSDFYQLRDQSGKEIFYGYDIYLQAGDTLSIKGAESDEDPVITGNAAYLNNYRWEAGTNLFSSDEEKEKFRNSPALEEKEYIDFVTEVKTKQNTFFDSYFEGKNLSDEYKKYAQTRIKLQYVNDFFKYLEYHNYYAHDDYSYIPSDSISISFLDEIKDIDESVKFVGKYKEYIGNLLKDKYYKSTIEIPDSVKYETEFKEKFETAKAEFTGFNKDIAIASLAGEFWKYFGQEDFYSLAGEIDTYFIANHTDEVSLNGWKNELESYKNIAPGKPAPDFTLTDSTGAEVSLSDFAGKVVYIDFYGTWCGPCRRALPFHIELQKEFAGNDSIVFMYVALERGDDYIENWKEYVASKEGWGGVHLVVGTSADNQEITPYKVYSVPSTVLIDKEGKIVAPRSKGPEEISDEINGLL